ncbi:hypothetical protein WEI85_33735 [Actinomycetes bacterium KLBMP 9797]
MRLRTVLFVILAAALLLGVGAAAGRRPATPWSTAGGPPATTDRLALEISHTQERLRLVPGDWTAWAALGAAYVERARVTGDPTYYPKAEGALRTSLDAHPEGNAPALTGLGALANARHDFAAGRDLALAALRHNGYLATAEGVLADAYTQLGDAGAATAAVQRMLDLRPGVAAFTRGAYDLEQRGQLDAAAGLLDRALTAAADPADTGYVRAQLAQLAWHQGDLGAAGRHVEAGLRVDPDSVELRRQRARLAAARGDLDAALVDAVWVTHRAPTADAFLDHATLLRAARRDPAEPLRLARAAQDLFTANGGADDLTGVALALAEGRPDEAVRLARREWQRRTFTDVADALGWALHLAGRSAEALPYARRASERGRPDATVAFHHGMIALATGDRDTARRQLRRALAANPSFSPLDAPVAARTLTALERS